MKTEMLCFSCSVLLRCSKREDEKYRKREIAKTGTKINNLFAKIEPERSLIDRDPQKKGEQRAVVTINADGLSAAHLDYQSCTIGLERIRQQHTM